MTQSFLMSVIMTPPLGLIIAMVAPQDGVTVFCCHVILEITLICSLIITLSTMILDTFMYGLNMFLKITLLCSLIITLSTGILDIFMFWLNMFLKITLVWSFKITLNTRILHTFMLGLYWQTAGPALLLLSHHGQDIKECTLHFQAVLVLW